MSRAPSSRSKFSNRDAFVDESLFGESQASRARHARQTKKSDFRSVGKTIVVKKQDTSALQISRSHYEAIKARANGKRVVTETVVQKKKGPKIDRLVRVKPTVTQEYTRRRRKAGEGGANAKALSMMDEELDEVKALKMRLNLMKVQRIREKQITEVKEQREDEDEYGRCWDEEMRRGNEAQIVAEVNRLRTEKRTKHAYARELLQQIDVCQRDQILEQERLEQEKVQMRKQIQKLQELELEKQREKRAIQQKRRAYLVKENKKNERYKHLKRQADVDEDLRIQDYITKKEYELEMQQAELEREKKEREMEVARLRALQKRSTDKKAEEDANRAKRMQQEHQRNADMKHAEKLRAKQQMMKEVLAERAKQIALKKRTAHVERDEDIMFMARIKNEQLRQLEREELLRLAKLAEAKMHAAEVLRLNVKRQKDEKIFKAQQRDRDQRNAMDEDVYNHRVKQVFKKKMAEHKQLGYDLPPDLVRPQETAAVKKARLQKMYRCRPLW